MQLLGDSACNTRVNNGVGGIFQDHGLGAYSGVDLAHSADRRNHISAAQPSSYKLDTAYLLRYRVGHPLADAVDLYLHCTDYTDHFSNILSHS